MLNRYPYNNGHIMLVPYKHCGNLTELDDASMHELSRLLQAGEQALREAYRCDGINVGINLGLAAGAGIAEHLHIHMVPRWLGDNNFMSVVSGERVIPEAFETSWHKLLTCFSNLLQDKV
jgi:ATP adenylyltransferase